MITRITMMLVLAVACTANTGCLSMRGYCPFGGGCQSGCDSCASCGLPEEASCCAPDASCGLPEASCCAPDASCGLPTDSCDTCTTSVGCGSPVVGRCRFLQRICDALHGRSSYCSDGYSSEAYWSEWHNDPPCSNCQASTPHAGAGDRGQYYSSVARRRSQRSKQGVNFGDELRFARQGSGPSLR